jgi:hypothetical protein
VIKEDGPGVVCRLAEEAFHGDVVSVGIGKGARRRTGAYVSKGQSGAARTWIKSGRVAASSLYTVQAEAITLRPPFSARLWVKRQRQSVTVSVWKGCVGKRG